MNGNANHYENGFKSHHVQNPNQRQQMENLKKTDNTEGNRTYFEVIVFFFFNNWNFRLLQQLTRTLHILK